MKDFRQITFETLFEEGLTSLKEKDFNISSLSENQNLRANQLFNNTKMNSERIENSIRTYSDNWSYERIGKVELITLTLGISELIMDLSPTKVIISEWVKLADKHSSSQSAKFVNGILDKLSQEI
ncbi:transcription antitermination protein NusB [bacterium]|jgi:N utilization substance protein B|nr:transcription antitermination protein NusB [bacterium]MEC8328932.1 transcription antitermination factor NusB [Actinomycetota bacterium]MED5382872.1 transcription antitermination factor NusB [Actinomycetota bacterium]